MFRMFTRSIVTTLSILCVIVLTTIIVPVKGHAIRPTRDTSQRDDHLNVSSNNDKTIAANVGESFSTEGNEAAIETFQSATDPNVEIITLPLAELESSSTTDINNNIEHRSESGKHRETTANVGESAILEPISQNITTNIATSSSSTKDISHDSMENRLPSNSNEETTESISTSDKNIKQSAEKLSEDGSISFVPLDKTKRLDTSIRNATQRGANLVDTTTENNNKSSSAPSHSAHPEAQTPRITQATETIRARVTTEQLKKQAKFLSDTNLGNPTSVVTHRSSEGVTDTWANIKTLNEVNHNKFTSAQSNDPINSVSGKIDQEELENAKTATNPTSTEKLTDDHETQLQEQKTAFTLNSNSRINEHVQQDNSLTPHQSTLEGPTNVAPVHNIPTLPQVDSHRNELSTNIQVQNVTTVPKSDIISHMTPNTSPMISSSEPITEGVTAEETASTTENEPTTTISSENNDTTMPDFVTTTTLRTVHAIENTTKTNEKVALSTESQASLETTTTEPETTTIAFTTSRENLIPETTPKRIQQDHSEKVNIITRSTTNSPSSDDLNLTTVAIAKPHATSSHRPILSTSSVIINSTATNGDSKIITKKVQPTQKMPEQKTISTSTTTTTVSSTTNEPEMPHNLNPKKTPTSTDSSDSNVDSTKEPTLEAGIGPQNEIDSKFDDERADINAIIAITISIVAVITLILLVGFLVVMRKRQKQLTYGQRCRPIGLDAYSLDNVSVYNSVRRKSAMRTSKRAFGNAGFDDPGLKNNPLSIPQLATFSTKRISINEEFRDIPMVTARIEEVPIGCEDKNRYANVVPLPESRIHLKQLDDDEKTEYINANFVKGPKDTTYYYIACQAPLEKTVIDFWRMIWEQSSKVIIMATDLTENGIEKCAEYLPSSFVIDNHVTFGDYQIILKNREVRDKYAVSTVHLKNACSKTWREITHFWYQWPDNGVPTDEASVIAMLLEARSYLKTTSPERYAEGSEQESPNGDLSNGHSDKSRSLPKVQGPLTVHCSPGTGRTGTIIACDIAIRSLEQPARMVDIPQIVYFVRRGRASAVQTREQYEFIYKVAHVYATKLTGPIDN